MPSTSRLAKISIVALIFLYAWSNASTFEAGLFTSPGYTELLGYLTPELDVIRINFHRDDYPEQILSLFESFVRKIVTRYSLLVTS